MASRISLTDTFEYVSLHFDIVQGEINSLYVRVSSRTEPLSERFNFPAGTNGHLPDEGTDDRDTLEIIQQIWASENGFRDADGNLVIPKVYEYPFGTTPESLTEHGDWNPLDAAAYDKWIARQQVLALFDGIGTDDIVKTILAGFGIEFQPVAVTEDAVTVNLGDSVSLTVYDEGRQFQIRVRYGIADNINDWADIRASLDMRAFFGWLNSIRTTGDISDLSAVTNLTTFETELSGRSWGDTEGSFSVAFESARVSTSGMTVGGVFYFIQIGAAFNVSANGTVITSELHELLEARNINVEPASTTQVYPKVSLPTEITVGDRKFRVIGSTAGFEVLGPNGEKFRIPLTGKFGVSYPWSELVGTAIIKNFPGDKIIDTIHFHESFNGRVILPRPRNLVESNSEYATLSIHNQGNPGDGYCEVADADGNLLLHCYDGEEHEYRAGLSHAGEEEIVAIRPPLRHLKMDIDHTLLPDVSDMVEFDWEASNNRMFLINFGQEVHRDADAFAVASANLPTGTPDIESGISDWNFQGTYEVLLNGTLNVLAKFGLLLTASGILSRWSGIRIFHIRGTTLTTIDYTPYEALSGNGNNRPYDARGPIPIQAGDRIAVFLRIRNADTTIPLSNIEIEGGKLDMWLQPQRVRV